MYRDTLVYTPGASLSPQNFPNDVMPNWVYVLGLSTVIVCNGPPESPCVQKVSNVKFRFIFEEETVFSLTDYNKKRFLSRSFSSDHSCVADNRASGKRCRDVFKIVFDTLFLNIVNTKYINSSKSSKYTTVNNDVLNKEYSVSLN